jgi:hypothetical protein
MAQERDIKYINREFDDFRTQLIEFTKSYFPDTYNDFSPSSPGIMFIEMASYVGDVLSFYQDTQLQETFLTHAKDPKNLYSLAYMMGYRPRTTGVSTATIEFTQIINADSASGLFPSWSQAAFVPENTVLTSTDSSQTKFILNKSVDFTFSSSFDPTEVTIETLENNQPSTYKLKKTSDVISSEIITAEFSVDSTQKFLTLTIEDTNIVGVLDIREGPNQTGNEWTEVPFLGQDTVFIEDDIEIPLSSYRTLSIKKVPRRFVTRHLSSGFLQLQFGAGTNDSDDSVIIPDPTNVGLGGTIGTSKLDQAYDPANFIHTRAYGIAPTAGTTLYVRYLKGGGVSSNVPANSITLIDFTSDNGKPPVLVNNPLPAQGGRDGDTVEELRENSLRSFSEQKRTVTIQDYTVRALSLPPQFGSIAKAYVTQEQLSNSATPGDLSSYNPFALSMYILEYDNTNKLKPAGPILKNNLKTYLSEFIPVTDSLNIKDAFIVNIGIEYEIIIRPNYSGRDVLLLCSNVLKDYFSTTKRSINQPINLSKVFTELDRVKGVQTVQKVEITNKQGGQYSQFAYDIKGATRNNVVYPSFDPSIFEVKFPDQDIKGRVTIL